MLLVTSVIASLLTIIFVKLSFAVIGLRRKNKVGLGSGGNEDLERAIRAQGNFAEYAPFGIILLPTKRMVCLAFKRKCPSTSRQSSNCKSCNTWNRTNYQLDQ